MKFYPFRETVYNCKQATRLSLKREEGKISFSERVKLFYHLRYCFSCRQFIRQSRLIDLLGRGMADAVLKNPPTKLSEERKKEIQHKMDMLD